MFPHEVTPRVKDRSDEFRRKGRKHVHNWQMTERRKNGVVIKLYACTTCTPAHMKAYDMDVIDPSQFLGQFEYLENHGG